MGDRKNSRAFPNVGTGRQRRWASKPDLTRRQSQCLALLIQGWRVKDIATAFGVRSTVVSEILHDAVFRRGLKTVHQLCAWYAIQQYKSDIRRVA